MKQLYTKLANYYIPLIPFGSTDTEFVFGNKIKLWKQEYGNNSYNYHGSEYNEVADTFYEAEIIGTENLSIDKRIEIHQELLNRLKKCAVAN